MGGHKHKGQAQRTKNNAKPANSGRIAELVDKGHHFPSFSGFSNESNYSTAPNTTAITTNVALEVLGPNVDPNFQVVLKKMNKKDATTRYKALQELKELCKGSSANVIVEVLPVWCRIYTLLAIDVEHRVREAVQEVHRLIVSAVGRNLAPHLKSIAPLWFLCQYDTYAPAASAATAAFQEAFPPHKVAEVIAFCQAEILQYIQENLLNLTPQSLSKGDLTKEEMELKYERIIICSLNGFGLYLSKVPFERVTKYESVLISIISSNKFWKFAKYKSPGVRSAWFSLLSSLCQHAASLLENEKKHVANTVIGSIDDYDSSVLSVVWEAALHSFTVIKDFWHHVNIDKFFLPKFCHMLKVGGQGNASCIYPNILLLLNSIPSCVIKDKQQFFGKIFTSFQEGMKQPIVDQSNSESEAVMSSYIECIQFLVMKNIEDIEFCNFILEQHLFKVIATSMVQGTSRHQLKPIPKALYRSLSQMLIYWFKNEGIQNYSILQKRFWEKFSSLSVEILRNSLVDKEQLSLCLNSQGLILNVLKCPNNNHRKHLRVSFVDDSMEDTTHHSKTVSMAGYEKNVFENKLEEAVISVAGILLLEYYQLALDTGYKKFQIDFITQIKSMVDLFMENLVNIIKSFQPNWGNSLLSWILSDEIPVQNILSLLFDTLPTIEVQQRPLLISQLTKTRSKECLLEGLRLASLKENADLKEWLHSDQIKNEICNIYDEINRNESFSLDIIKHCFLLDKSGDFVIGGTTILALVEKIENQLLLKTEFNIKIASKAVNILIDNVSSEAESKHELIVLKLLEPLFVNIVHGNGNIVYDTWYKGVLLLSKYDAGQKCLEKHLENVSNQLGVYITTTEMPFDVKLIHRSVIALLSVLVRNDDKRMENFGMPCIRQLLTSVFSKAVQESQRQIESVCLIAEVIKGNLPIDTNVIREFSSCEEVQKWRPLYHINTLGFVNSLIFSIKIIASALGVDIGSDHADSYDDDDDDEGGIVASLPSLPKETTHEFCEYLVELTYGLVLLQKLRMYYFSTKEYFDVECFVEPLEKDVKELVQICKTQEQEKIINIARNRYSQNGLLWAKVKDYILDFLDGTFENSTEIALREECEVPGSVLEICHIQKLRKIIDNKGLSQNILNETLRIISERYKETYPQVEKELSYEEKDYLLLSAEIARLFNEAISASPLLLSQQSWDFARINVVTWLNRIALSDQLHNDYIEFVSLISAVCSLLSTLSNALSNEPALDSYGEEWREVFAADAFFFLCKSWQLIIEKSINGSVDPIRFIHIETLSEAICFLCSLDSYCKLKLNSESIQDSVNFVLTGILAPSVPVQLTSYKLLYILLPYMMDLDENLDESSLDKVSCNMLEHKLLETQTVVMTMLHDFSIGISCSVEPFTDSYTYSLGYLLLWSVLIQFCYRCESQQKYLYPLWIREKDIISHFIEAAVKLMPECVLYFQESNNKKGLELFTSSPSLTFSGWTSEKLSHLSCWLLTELMGHLPAIVRQWASEAEPKQLSFVDGITTAFISPYLCSREMEAIKGQQKSFDNMKVITHPSIGEVIAVYTVEESTTELSVQLSNNYPLSPPKVDISKAMISSIQTRQWLKQLTIFLTHQNGSIWDGLILWKSNLDKKFEGVEECYICFSILHNTTHQLPKLSCHTCKKKFHSFCLFKWFSTSNKSTCPICRAIF